MEKFCERAWSFVNLAAYRSKSLNLAYRCVATIFAAGVQCSLLLPQILTTFFTHHTHNTEYFLNQLNSTPHHPPSDVSSRPSGGCTLTLGGALITPPKLSPQFFSCPRGAPAPVSTAPPGHVCDSAAVSHLRESQLRCSKCPIYCLIHKNAETVIEIEC